MHKYIYLGNFNIIPNPAKEGFVSIISTVLGEAGSIATIKIFDNIGQIVEQKKLFVDEENAVNLNITN